MSKKKKVKHVVNLTIASQEATPGPPIGTVLGPKGINLGEFCKQINVATSKFDKGTPVPTVLTIYDDRSFDFVMKAPPASFLIKKAVGITKGASSAKKETVGEVSRSQLAEIAEIKLPYTNARSMESVIKLLEGSARSMGVKVVD